MYGCQTHRHAAANIKLDMEKMLEQQKKEREQERREREQERREREQERREREQERREREDDRKKREQERKERDENEKVLLEYEIFDRIAQGIMSCDLYSTLFLMILFYRPQ
jgi:hypothetical protein